MLRLAGIDNLEAAKRGDAFVSFVRGQAGILSVQEDRVVGRDNTARCAGLMLQIPESRRRQHNVKARVWAHEHEDVRLCCSMGRGDWRATTFRVGCRSLLQR